MTASPNQDEVLAIRGKLWQNGFRPVAVFNSNAVEWTGKPITNAGKRPKGNDWPERARENPPEASIRKPDSDVLNTGILCDGLCAVDIDVDDPSIVSQVEAAALHFLGPAPKRTRANSARILLLYRAAVGEPSKQSITGNGGKIETLGHGQQFVAFGIHPEGANYEWDYAPDSFHRDTLTPVAEEAVFAFLCAVSPLIGAEQPMPRTSAPAAFSVAPGAAHVKDCHRNWTAGTLRGKLADMRLLTQENSNRNKILNDELFEMGGYVSNGSIDYQPVVDSFFAVMVENGYAAVHSEGETMKTIQRSIKEGMEKALPLKGTDIDAPADSTLDTVRESVQKWITDYMATQVQNKPAKEWPASLNDDAYIGIAGDFIRLVAPQTEGDPCALLIAFLTVVGSLIGRGAYLPVGPTHHYGNLFSVIIAETSKGRKGTVMAEAKRFATMIDPTISTRMLGGLSSGEGLIEAVRDARIDDAPIEPGKLPIAKVVDNGVADKRLLVTESEMGQALQAAGRDGNTLSAVLRMAWDGEQLRTLARSNKNICREPHISIFGNITLDELQRLLTSTDRTNGFANRFLWVCARRSQELPWGGSVDEAALIALAAKAAHVINSAAYYGKCGWVPDAASLWAREYSRLSSGRPGLSGAMSARAEAQTLRIALIYAVLDGCNNVDIPHLRAALEVWRYCQDSVDYCFGGTMTNSTADRILGMLAGIPEGASLTQISNHFGRNKKSDELQRALITLRESGKARSESRKTNGRAADIWFAC